MLRKLLESLVIWLVVAVVLWLVAAVLLTIDTDLTQAVGDFLNKTNVVIGFLAGLWHFFFGFRLDRRA